VDPAAAIHARAHTSGTGDGNAVALKRVFLLLERYRRRLARGSLSKRPSRRYEELCLAAAVAGLERHLRVAEQVTDASGIRSWIEDALAEEWVGRDVLHRDVAWLTSRARRRAVARARRRFEPIAAEVIAALAEPPPEPATHLGRCTAVTRRGTRCKNRAETNGLCGLHARFAADPATDPASQEAATGQPASNEPAANRHPPREAVDAAAWAVAALVLLASVLAWIGVPLGTDAPVGSRVVVRTASARSATTLEPGTAARLQSTSAGDRLARTSGRRSGDRGNGRRADASDGGRTESASGTSAGTGSDTSAAFVSSESAAAPPTPAPSPGADGAANRPGPTQPSRAEGTGQAATVRGDLVDEMLDLP
jgi:hypothetical protein